MPEVQQFPKFTQKKQKVHKHPLIQKIKLQDTKACYVTGRLDVEQHHCLYGKNRKNADDYGLTVWLTQDYHTGKHGVHKGNLKLDKELKRLAQTEFEKVYTHEHWMNVFCWNYL
jgi:hypothetical protein